MIHAWDIEIFRWLNGWDDPSLIDFLAVYLFYAVTANLAIFAASTFLFPRLKIWRAHALKLASVAYISAFVARVIVAEPLRILFARARPFEVLEGVRQLVDHPMGHSFPSGHASLTFALAMAVVAYHPRLGVLFFLGAILVGIGRVAGGIHWPSDIVGGAIVGIISAWLARKVLKNYKFFN